MEIVVDRPERAGTRPVVVVAAGALIFVIAAWLVSPHLAARPHSIICAGGGVVDGPSGATPGQAMAAFERRAFPDGPAPAYRVTGRGSSRTYHYVGADRSHETQIEVRRTGDDWVVTGSADCELRDG